MSARVSTAGDVFRWEPPQPLFALGMAGIAPDGERFLVQVPNPESRAQEIHVELNWFEVLTANKGS